MTGRAQLFVFLGAANAFIAVAAGAFGAHGLAKRLEPRLLEVWKTGATYHMTHALALVLVGLLVGRAPGVGAAGWAFCAGIVLFSGSLYALALSGVAVLGAITPLGGLGFLAGWVLLAVAALRA